MQGIILRQEKKLNVIQMQCNMCNVVTFKNLYYIFYCAVKIEMAQSRHKRIEARMDTNEHELCKRKYISVYSCSLVAQNWRQT